MKKTMLLVAVLVLLAGCIHGEIEWPDGPSIYYSRSGLSPENVTIRANPDGTFEVVIGEQASQRAMIGDVLKLGIAIGGGIVP